MHPNPTPSYSPVYLPSQVRDRWKQAARRTVPAGGSPPPPTAAELRWHEARAALEQYRLPQSPSARLFQKRDIGLGPFANAIVDLREEDDEVPPPAEADTSAAAQSSATLKLEAARTAIDGFKHGLAPFSGRTFSRSVSETVLQHKLDMVGAKRRWTGGARGVAGQGEVGDLWSILSFDRIANNPFG